MHAGQKRWPQPRHPTADAALGPPPPPSAMTLPQARLGHQQSSGERSTSLEPRSTRKRSLSRRRSRASAVRVGAKRSHPSAGHTARCTSPSLSRAARMPPQQRSQQACPHGSRAALCAAGSKAPKQTMHSAVAGVAGRGEGKADVTEGASAWSREALPRGTPEAHHAGAGASNEKVQGLNREKGEVGELRAKVPGS
mmetsp:Transcript_33409/g.79209  ORF Transcript_33409/g.79209 Transcript_33409/m.79209 type:complete len:196 (+) Transcript_33409:1142-1729(+)